MYWLDLLWNLVLVFFLVFLNGFFVATEFAIVKVRDTQLMGLKGPRVQAARHATTHLDAYLSACQLGITIASLALGWLGEPAVAHFVVEPLMGRFLTSPDAIVAVSFAIAFAIITALHIVVGELAPKTLAIRTPRATALWVSLPIRGFRKVFAPVIWVLNGSANLLLRLVGVQPLSTNEEQHTVEELRALLARVPARERTKKKSAEVASRVFALHDLTVRDIMVPRDQMVFLDIQSPFPENLKVVEEHPYTRYPLADGGPDSVLGFVHMRDVLAAAKRGPEARIADLIREVHVLPNSQPVSRSLFEMLETRKPMAIVVNEFGFNVGLLTLEDIFEELVGNIPSEFERADSRLRVLAPGHYLVDATMPLHELQVLLREPLDEAGASTLAGLLNEAFGRIPGPGEKIEIGRYSYLVKEASRQRARLVEIRRVEDVAVGKPPAGEAATGSGRGRPAS